MVTFAIEYFGLTVKLMATSSIYGERERDENMFEWHTIHDLM